MKLQEFFVTVVSYIVQPKKRRLILLSKTFKNKVGVEIGGPSSSFSIKGYFPVYLFAKKIDGVNYSADTEWQGHIQEGENYKYGGNRVGFQFICEGTHLHKIENSSYDFLLSSHNLEHIANPIKALKEWHRVLKPNGSLILILPDKRFTFDYKRPYTAFGHLLQDEALGVDETDNTHFEEVYALHDATQEPTPITMEQLKKRTQNNFINRCVHHHIFSFEVLQQMLAHCGFSTTYQQAAAPFHLIIIAKKN